MYTRSSTFTLPPGFDVVGLSSSADTAANLSDFTKDSETANKSFMRLNALSNHLNSKESTDAKDHILIRELLSEKVLLFRNNGTPEDLGLSGTKYDARFTPNLNGLSEEWQAWKDTVFLRLSKMYAGLAPNEAVFMSVWHPNMYSGEITHVSAIMVGKTPGGPQVELLHHESIPIPFPKPYEDGRFPRSLGLRLNRYDTRHEFKKITGNSPSLKDLPIVRSIEFGGFPNINFLVARDFSSAVEYIQACQKVSDKHFSDLIYAPFSSAEKQAPKHTYPFPDSGHVPLEHLQINTCYSAIIDLAIASKVDGYKLLKRANLPEQGQQMLAVRLLSNTESLCAYTPGIPAFKSYTSQAGVDPRPKNSGPQAEFDIQGTFLKKLKQDKLTLSEYRKAIQFLKTLPQLTSASPYINASL